MVLVEHGGRAAWLPLSFLKAAVEAGRRPEQYVPRGDLGDPHPPGMVTPASLASRARPLDAPAPAVAPAAVPAVAPRAPRGGTGQSGARPLDAPAAVDAAGDAVVDDTVDAGARQAGRGHGARPLDAEAREHDRVAGEMLAGVIACEDELAP